MAKTYLKGKHLVLLTLLLLLLTGLTYAAARRNTHGQAAQKLQQAAQDGQWEEYLRLLQEQESDPAEKLYTLLKMPPVPPMVRDTIYLFPPDLRREITGQQVRRTWPPLAAHYKTLS